MRKTQILNRNQIKYLAIIAMLIDHIAWTFVPKASALGQCMHFVGRLTAPIMAFFLAEGYVHTRNVKKYALRLGVFALISWPAITYYEYRRLPIMIVGNQILISTSFSVIYTLFLSLLAVWLWDRKSLGKAPRIMGILGLCFLAEYGDWGALLVVYTLFFFIYRQDEKKKWIAYSLISAGMLAYMLYFEGRTQLFQAGVFMVPLLMLFFYNGEPGSRHPVHKWFFYVFYPAHLLLLAIWRW